MWENGRGAATRVPSPMPLAASAALNCTALAVIERWVNSTPLGSPVVPEENGMTATEPGSAGAKASAGPGARSPGSIRWVTPARAERRDASASISECPIKHVVAPVRETASSAATKSMELGSRSSTTLPGSTRRFRRRVAAASATAHSSS